MQSENVRDIHLYRCGGSSFACRWGVRCHGTGVSLRRKRNRNGRKEDGMLRVASGSSKKCLGEQCERRGSDQVVECARGSFQGSELHRTLDHDRWVRMHRSGLESDGIVEQQHRVELSLLWRVADPVLQLVFVCRVQRADLRIRNNTWMDEQPHVLCPLRLNPMSPPPPRWWFGESGSRDTMPVNYSSADHRLGDPVAFDAFYRSHAENLLRYFYRRTDDPDVAADLCAETFAAALSNSAQFDANRGAPTTWLYGIAKRQLAMYWRRRKVAERARKRLGVPKEHIDEESAQALRRTEDIIDGAAALAALEKLPFKLREAVRLRVIGQLEYPEIARELKCSEGSARVRVCRGLHQLRETLQ